MNWVSYSEDIEELRQDNLHHMRGFDNLLERLRDPPSLGEIQKVEKELKSLSLQLVAHFEKTKKQAKATFDEALKYLQDPDVLITKKLDKRTKERDALRDELLDCRTQLEACRKSQQRSLNKIKALGEEKAALTAELDKLKDNKDWLTEKSTAVPLRRR
jgi:chromosome segregation ATPase